MYYHYLTFLVFHDLLVHLSTVQLPLYVLAPLFPKQKQKQKQTNSCAAGCIPLRRAKSLEWKEKKVGKEKKSGEGKSLE